MVLTTPDPLFEPDDECNPNSLRYNLGCVLFKGYGPTSRHILYSLVVFLSSMSTVLKPMLIFLSTFGVFVSLFHLAVQSQKSMRTSSANILLLGIAICDIFSLLNTIKSQSYNYRFNGDHCSPPTSLLVYQLNIIIECFLKTFRRCSSVLGVCLASIRYCAVRFFMTADKFTRPRTGVLAILISLAASSFFGVYSWLQYSFVRTGTWTSNYTCPDLSADSYPIYQISVNDTFFGSGDTLLTTLTFWDGVFSKLIPSAFFPILSILLLVQLAKTKSARSYVHSAGETPRKDRTTVLITFITFSFMLSEVPLGIITAIRSFLSDEDGTTTGFGYLFILSSNFWNLVFILTSVFHCLLCFSLSVQYRETAYSLFRNPFKKKNRIEESSQSAHKLPGGANSAHRSSLRD